MLHYFHSLVVYGCVKSTVSLYHKGRPLLLDWRPLNHVESVRADQQGHIVCIPNFDLAAVEVVAEGKAEFFVKFAQFDEEPKTMVEWLMCENFVGKRLTCEVRNG